MYHPERVKDGVFQASKLICRKDDPMAIPPQQAQSNIAQSIACCEFQAGICLEGSGAVQCSAYSEISQYNLTIC